MRRPNHASRFEGIAKTKLQASRASDTETLQSQVTKAGKKRLLLSGLEILHGRLDNFNTTPQELPLSTQPPQEPQPATAPRQEQPTPKIKKIAKLTMAVVLAAIAIVLCTYAFILTTQ